MRTLVIILIASLQLFAAFKNNCVITINTTHDAAGRIVDFDFSALGDEFWDNVQTDGSDIRFTTIDDTTTVPRYLNTFNSITKTGWAHIKKGYSSTGTQLRLWWNDAAVDEINDSTVFQDYAFALSMDVDETNMAKTIPKIGDVSDDTSGVIGRAKHFTAANQDYITYRPPQGTKQFDPGRGDYDGFGKFIDYSIDTAHYFFTSGTAHSGDHKILSRRIYRKSDSTWFGNDSIFDFGPDYAVSNIRPLKASDTTCAIAIAKYNNTTSKYESIGYIRSEEKTWNTFSGYNQLDTAWSDSAIFGATGNSAECYTDSNFTYAVFYKAHRYKWITNYGWRVTDDGNTWTQDTKIDSLVYPNWANETGVVNLGNGKLLALTCKSTTAGGRPLQYTSSDYGYTWSSNGEANIGDSLTSWKTDPAIRLFNNKLYYAGVDRAHEGMMVGITDPDSAFANSKRWGGLLCIDNLETSYNGYADMVQAQNGNITVVYSYESVADSKAEIYGLASINKFLINRLPSQQASISLWVKHDDVSIAGGHMVFDWRSVPTVGGVTYNGFYFNVSSGAYYAGMSTDVSSYLRRTGTAVSGEWQYVTLVFNNLSSGNNKILFYINGVETGTAQSFGVNLYGFDGINIYYMMGASWYGLTNNYSGSVDEVRFSNYAKSADDILAEYNMQSGTIGYTVLSDINSVYRPEWTNANGDYLSSNVLNWSFGAIPTTTDSILFKNVVDSCFFDASFKTTLFTVNAAYSGSINFGASVDTVLGTTTFGGGSIFSGSSTLNLSADVDVSGATITSGASTINLVGTSDCDLTTGNNTIYDLVCAKTGGTVVFIDSFQCNDFIVHADNTQDITTNANIRIAGDFTLGGTGVFDCSGDTIYIDGDFTGQTGAGVKFDSNTVWFINNASATFDPVPGDTMPHLIFSGDVVFQ